MKKNQLCLLLTFAAFSIFSCNKSNLHPTDQATNDYKLTGNWIKPANFVSGINNPYLPETIGDSLFYENIVVDQGDTSDEHICVTPTGETKLIMGITCMVVHDVVTVNDTITEDTHDYFAQDVNGTVWYFGENTAARQADGTFTHEGTFIADSDGAQPGVVMFGNPQDHIGQRYQQELYAGHAEDKAKVVEVGVTLTIGIGTYTNCVHTQEHSPIEPDVLENKWYAPGIGEIKASVERGGDEHEELTGTN